MGLNDVGRPGPLAGVRALAVFGMMALLSVGCPRAVKPADVALLAAPAASPPVDCEKTTGYDVLIVGAGMSGLTAAKELLRGQPELKVLILEATDRIGGRARTLKKGPPIDLGGAWIHGVATNQLTGIVDSLGFKRVTTRLDAPYFTEKGRVDDKTARELWKTNDEFQMLLRQAARTQLTLRECHSLFPKPFLKSTEITPRRWEKFEWLPRLCEQLREHEWRDNAGLYQIGRAHV